MKKVATSKIENYKITQGLSAKEPTQKIRIANFKNNVQVSVFDFFHVMRLRMNYRNLNFVDNVRASDAKAYFEQYYLATDNFYNCFKKYTADLIRDCA